MTLFNPDGDIPAQLALILNEGIEFNDNVRGALLEVELVVGENEIFHGTGFIPTGYIVLVSEADGSVLASRIDEWTTEVMFLRSNVVNPRVRLCVV